MDTVVTFGEIMGRMAPSGFLRLRQTRGFDITYAGAEASVAASIANFGGSARYVTALPNNPIAEAALDTVRAVGIDTSCIVRTDVGRLGLYFLETGANHRPSNVIYDRADSSIALTPAQHYDWQAIFDGAAWLHLSGITPALSSHAAQATLAAAQHAQSAGVTVSIDLNFRGKLWKWDSSKSTRALARQTMEGILPYVDVVVGNEEDCHDVLDISAGDTDVHALRESLSATHNNWGAMLYDGTKDHVHFAPHDDNGEYRPYEIKNIVDRVGGGDAFAGGLIFALTTPELSDPGTAVKYAVAASCLKHSIKGDFNYSTRQEVEKLLQGATSGRVVR